MLVVSDTTPIISLLKVNRIDVLEFLFGEVYIPNAVYKELTSNQLFIEEAEKIKNSAFIKTVNIPMDDSLNMLRRATGLDLGESEAIYYADTHEADLLLMDEAKGREVAKTMGLKITGTIGILIAAYREKYLSKEEILRIISILRNSGRHISDQLFRILIDEIEK